ncbi:MAG: TetR/AcrR family transcriptional regulator [Desulfatibacillaceae bacterium]
MSLNKNTAGQDLEIPELHHSGKTVPHGTDSVPRANNRPRQIVDAARKVFTRHPYTSASIRMIEKEGDFDHSLIRYYFKGKQGLFEAVMEDLLSGFLDDLLRTLMEMTHVPAERALEPFIDHFFDHAFRNPELMEVMILNTGEKDIYKSTLFRLWELQQAIRENFKALARKVGVKAEDSEITTWLFAFSMCAGNYIGARNFHARILGMDADSEAYRNWAGATMKSVFGPAWKEMLDSRKKPARRIDPFRERKHNAGPRNPLELERGRGRYIRERKGEITRRKVLAAASRVFSTRPYDAASLRVIGKEGGFDFTTIRYYYPSKAELFDQVCQSLHNEYRYAVESFFSGLEDMGMWEGLSAYLDRVLSFSFRNPGAPGVLMQIAPQFHRLRDEVDIRHIEEFHKDTLRAMTRNIPIQAPDEKSRMWEYSLAVMIYNFVGASAYPAAMLGLDPGSRKYKQWIKDCLMFIFYPGLKQLVYNS